MVKLYADEQFSLSVVKILRTLEYDLLTVQEAGKAEQKIPDPEVLHYAISLNRAVLTIVLQDVVKRVKVMFDRFLKGNSNGHRSGKLCFKSRSCYKIFEAIAEVAEKPTLTRREA